MSPRDPGWTGTMDGPFRGSHLVRCPKHTTIWRHQEDACPVCVLEGQIATLTRDRDQRCADCKKGLADRTDPR